MQLDRPFAYVVDRGVGVSIVVRVFSDDRRSGDVHKRARNHAVGTLRNETNQPGGRILLREWADVRWKVELLLVRIISQSNIGYWEFE